MSSMKIRIQKKNPIALDAMLVDAYGPELTAVHIRRAVKSVNFEVLNNECAMRLLGPDMRYHQIDPFLIEALNCLRSQMSLDDVLPYKSRYGSFDLCLEDSWTGYFIAEKLENVSAGSDIVLIHLDDHTDMMPTLLSESDGRLVNPATDNSFDPTSAENWEEAIYSGCLTIGSFITPLFYSKMQIHVRHINNNSSSTYDLENVVRESCSYPIIPGHKFASVQRSNSEKDRRSGTYLGGANANRALQGLPAGCTFVHFDLDYFINDYNGNPMGSDYVPPPALADKALKKIALFFDSLNDLDVHVDHWIVGTSPGFCSGMHWDWLLKEIDRRILQFGRT